MGRLTLIYDRMSLKFTNSDYFCSLMDRKKFVLIVWMLLAVAGAWAQVQGDAKCISIMGAPLEGPDSVFIPVFEQAGFVQAHPEEPEEDTYYFAGDFYGIKSSVMVNVDEKTKLLSSVIVECGPYRTRELFDRNKKYLLGKLQREWGNFSAKGDGSLYLLNDYGYIQESQIGQVQEVITQNPVMEGDIVHFSETGVLEADELVDRKYNSAGYLVSASMIEQNGGKSHLTYEYDSDNCLVKRTLMNPTTGIRSVNEYRYNTSFEIIQQSLKAFSKENECVLSITMKNDLSERDDNGNWTKNKVQLTYWEKGQRSQINQVEQTRVISYWDE